MAKQKHKFTPEQEKQVTELYLKNPHTNPEIIKATGLSRAILNYAIELFNLQAQFQEKHGMSKSQYMVSKINLSTDNPECPHTGKKAIRHWYIDKMLTAPEIAKKLGLEKWQIRYKIKLYKLAGKKPKGYKPPKERIKDLTTIITDTTPPRRITRDFTAVNKKFQPNVKSNFDDAKQARNKVHHLLTSDLSTLDITKLTATTCRGINTKNGKDTFCLTQIEPLQTYCQHHRSVYYARQQA
ncbi:MAG: hypothetical protein EBU90_25950 [Proteobacteria bacterium]|nr:hypothetical protein [Pseudomonadota bacterium]